MRPQLPCSSWVPGATPPPASGLTAASPGSGLRPRAPQAAVSEAPCSSLGSVPSQDHQTVLGEEGERLSPAYTVGGAGISQWNLNMGQPIRAQEMEVESKVGQD